MTVSTSAPPGPETDVPEGPSVPMDAPPTWRRIVPWLGDAYSGAVLVAVWWYWAEYDGGLSIFAAANAGVVILIGLPFAVAEAARLPRSTRLALAVWGVGALASFAFATERSSWIDGLFAFGLAPLVGLATLRLWRRPWGPPVIVAVLLLSLGRYWYGAFLAWWGHLLNDDQGRWLALSWHNQSGMLMGVGSLVFAGIAISGRRIIAVAGALVAAACGAGVLLSGSRGALAATAVGAVVVAVAALLHRGPRRVLPAVAGVGAAGVAVVVLLLGMSGGYDDAGGASDPLTGREESASQNLMARAHHMLTGARMFLDRPLTGHGPGAYGVSGLEFTDADANLTTSAHNEYVEAFAEGGLLLGVPVAGLAVGALVLVAGTLRRLRGVAVGTRPDDLRVPVVVGATGAVVALVLHAAIDFDWSYPVLPALLAAALAILLAGRHDHVEQGGGIARGLVVIPIALALVLPVVGAFIVRAHEGGTDLDPAEYAVAGLPWDSDTAEVVALELLEDGHTDEAAIAVDRPLAWSPGDHGLRAVRVIVEHRAGAATPEQVVAAIERRGVPLYMRPIAAKALMDNGDTAAARGVLERALPTYASHVAWGVEQATGDAWLLLIELDGREHGCARARRTAEAAREDPVLANARAAAIAQFADVADTFC